jgi:hypothetical protein
MRLNAIRKKRPEKTETSLAVYRLKPKSLKEHPNRKGNARFELLPLKVISFSNP